MMGINGRLRQNILRDHWKIGVKPVREKINWFDILIQAQHLN